MKVRRLVVVLLWLSLTIPVSLRSQSAPSTEVTLFDEAFTRAVGAPVQERRVLLVPTVAKAPFTVHVTNGAASTTRVTSARISLNGAAIVGPAEMKQGVSNIVRSIGLLTSNTLEVELAGEPGSSITIRITGRVDGDRLLQQTTLGLGSAGGSLSLPGIATVQVPPNAVANATVEMTSVDSAFVKFLATRIDQSISLLDVPALRIKSSVPFTNQLELRLRVTNLAGSVPVGRRITFVVLERHFGANGESIDTISPVGGRLCGSDFACVTLSPDWFLPVNPADPNDPVIQLALATRPTRLPQQGQFHVWQVQGLAPVGTVDQTTTGQVSFGATFQLTKNFTFSSPLGQIIAGCRPGGPDPCISNFSPVPGPVPNTCERIYGTNLCIIDGFFRGEPGPNGRFHPHKSVDLRTLDRTGSTEQAIYPVMSGRVGGRVTQTTVGTGGYLFWVQHDSTIAAAAERNGPGLITGYMHLKACTPEAACLPPTGTVVDPNTQMTTSDSTGVIAGHLHIQSSFEGQNLDTEPLLADDLTLFLKPDPNDGSGVRLRLHFASNQGAYLDSPSQSVLGLTTQFQAGLTGAELSTLCPNAIACVITAELALFGDRFGGDRELAEWTVAVRRQPVISSLLAQPTSVTAGGQSTVSVVASDPDGDPLTYAWTTTCGSLSASAGGGSKVFTAPSASGNCRVSVTVTDTTGSSATKNVDIAVNAVPTAITTYTSESLFNSAAGPNQTASFNIFPTGFLPQTVLQMGSVTVTLTNSGSAPIFAPPAAGFSTKFLSTGVQDGSNNVLIDLPFGTKAVGMKVSGSSAIAITAIDENGGTAVTHPSGLPQIDFRGFSSQANIWRIRISSPLNPQSTPIVQIGDITFASQSTSPPAVPQVLTTTYGPNASFQLGTGTAWAIGGPGNASAAVSYVNATATFVRLERFRFAANWFSGTSILNVGLWVGSSDLNSATLLESFVFTTTATQSPRTFTAFSDTRPLISPGETIFITLSVPGAPGTIWGWHWNNQGQTGYLARFGTDHWFVAPGQTPAFEILGTQVSPVPAGSQEVLSSSPRDKANRVRRK